MEPVRVGVVGTGNISGIYLENSHKFPEYEVVAVADILQDRAQAQADKYSIPKATSPDELIADPDVELVLNLTIPAVHADVAMRSLNAGKVAYGEKPFATNREDGQAILALGKEKGLLVGCAPDTFLGAGFQTMRQAVDSGRIGAPVAANMTMVGAGPDVWHPDPTFFFQAGGGPVLDMGPYYVTAIVSLLGPVKRVSAKGRSPRKERTIGAGPKAGQTIPVEIMTTVSAQLELESGALVDFFLSWDVWGTNNTNFEIYGEEGALSGWDPNTFGGPIQLRTRAIARENGWNPVWEELELVSPHSVNSRGLGLADISVAHRTGATPRASGELAYHVLDVLLAILDSAERDQPVDIASTVQRPEALPAGLQPWTVTL
ncbi:MAG TPA: Gfo/Idh/MocA family oxidoreductase [Thermomicrobiales bacterium]|nr:Gfo/Idh/MocA family oxidoreductase [Thermomicrobiales bacterium]